MMAYLTSSLGWSILWGLGGYTVAKLEVGYRESKDNDWRRR